MILEDDDEKEVESSNILIGRREEMKIFNDYIPLVLNKKGAVVLLKGEGGVGKSHLAEAFANKCSDQGFEVLKGRCLYYESTDPYIPFLEAMGDYLKEEKETTRQSTVPVSSIPMSLVGMGAEIEDESIEVSLSDKRELMFDKVTSAIIEHSKEKPILLFLDDLQWIDEASALLLHHLARHTSDNRVLILGAYRTEELRLEEKDVPLAKILKRMIDEKLVKEMEVNRLSFQNSSKMIKIRLGLEDLPPSFLQMMYRECEGNPYYIVEMLNSMVDEGVIDPYAYKWDPERDLSDIIVPASIKDITRRRIENLSTEEKKVMMYASIIGAEFNFEVLEHSIDMDVIELLDIIDDLKAKGLIQEEDRSEEEVYRFTHVQMRAVIYENMGKSRRRVLHQLVGNAVEEVYQDKPEEHYYSLSRHFFNGKNFSKAYDYSIKAGNKATQSFALESALEYYEKALSSLRSIKDIKNKGEKKEDLLKLIGELSRDISDWDRARKSYEKLLKRAETEDDNLLKAEALRKLGHIYRESQDFQGAKEFFEKALDISKNIKDHNGIADANRGLGYLHWREGKFEDALEHHEEVIEKAEKVDDKLILALTYIDLGNIYAHRGDYDTAIQYYKQSLPVLNEQNAFRELAKAHNNLGDQYMKKEDWNAAIEHLEKCEEKARKIGNKTFIGWSYFNRAEALSYIGEIREAKFYAGRAEKLMRNLNDVIGLSSVYRVRGIINKEEGKLEEALYNFQRALDTIKGLEIPFTYAESRYGMGEIYQIMGDVDRARKTYLEIIDILERIGAEQFLELVEDSLRSLPSDQE